LEELWVLLAPGGFPPSSLGDMHTLPLYLVGAGIRTPLLGPLLVQTIKQITFALSHLIPKLHEQLPQNSTYPLVRSIDSNLLSIHKYILHLGFQFHKTPLFTEYFESLYKRFPFYGPIETEIFERVRNHPKKVLILWGTDGSYSCIEILIL
jgi:hypothetical protein